MSNSSTPKKGNNSAQSSQASCYTSASPGLVQRGSFNYRRTLKERLKFAVREALQELEEEKKEKFK